MQNLFKNREHNSTAAKSGTSLLRRSSINQMAQWGIWACGFIALFFVFVLARGLFNAFFETRTAIAEMNNGIRAIALPASQPRSTNSGDYAALSKKPLFGALTSAVRPTAAPTPKPANNLTLSLIGTFTAAGETPFAIIEDQKKSLQEPFKINESIFGDAQLKSISIDRVTIERNGQIEELVIDEFGAGKRDSGKLGSTSGDGERFTVDETELDKALDNLPLLLTQARAVPYFKDGKSVGLRLFAIKPGSLFEKVGLRNGDILKSVNGSSLGDITQAMKLFEVLKEERSIAVKLERDQSDRDMRYEIQ